MGEKHRALRVALRRREQRVEHGRRAPLRPGEPLLDVRGDLRFGQPAEPQRLRLAVERPSFDVEELAHHPRLRAGEDVRRRLALVLDVAAEKLVEVLHLADVLELVERDQHPLAAALRDALRQVK